MISASLARVSTRWTRKNHRTTAEQLRRERLARLNRLCLPRGTLAKSRTKCANAKWRCDPHGCYNCTMPIATINSATGETLKTFELYDEAEIERRLALADSAFRSYRRTSFDDGAKLVSEMADVFEQDADSFARTLTLEMGKPTAQARNEVAKCVGVLRYYAQHAAAMLADEPVTTTAAKHGSYLKYQPIGPVLAVMPWNFPLWQVIRFATPTFMVGNVGVANLM